ncbi:GIY-YIG nuclease family protein [Janthinobacterium fluminis]|uniref:GIY-YIG nuclease family protein n=1 Tax=Janthinobacterium fluminis TaxID=2987524 RepID=A0ABT5KA62_9BURK|nr:GIY-YIG nuclease family protein [Janthinobacterium fluminis]MDC8760722.1 GIY-YIG nuclease family protein [Janthinobacterium fluminis]
MNRSRQAELKSSYKLNPPEMGVFAIRHVASGKMLLDRSTNLPAILNRHRFELTLGRHRNAALLADWKRDGAAGFRFEVLGTVEPSGDPGFDAEAELDALLGLHLEMCPRGAPLSYL